MGFKKFTVSAVPAQFIYPGQCVQLFIILFFSCATLACDVAGPVGDALRLSPTRKPYGHPNPKWVARDPKSASNRVPIRETYFGLPERHSPNMVILSPENPFAEMILFWILLL